MAYYCGECIVWRGSSDEDRYGRRWCPYDQKYRESNQQTYGCGGFVYVGRAVLTEVCDALQLTPCAWFTCFDAAREHAVAEGHWDWIDKYSHIGPALAKRIHEDTERVAVSKQVMQNYLMPALENCRQKEWEKAINSYRCMLHELMEKYQIN